jgi:hypothetical protein
VERETRKIVKERAAILAGEPVTYPSHRIQGGG